MKFRTLESSYALIRWCGTIHEYIVEMHPTYGEARPGESVHWRIKDRPDLDFEALRSFLWERYRQPLADQEFSWENRGWRRFSAAEVADIKTTLEEKRPSSRPTSPYRR
jgi:hypothetical protein